MPVIVSNRQYARRRAFYRRRYQRTPMRHRWPRYYTAMAGRRGYAVRLRPIRRY